MARLRYNGLGSGSAGSVVAATLSGSHTNSTTTLTFAAALTYANGTAVPTLSGSDYFMLSILNSSGQVQEIVKVTAYTSDATTATVTRGQEGYAGVSHSSGATVVHAPTVLDMPGSPRVRVTPSALESMTNDTNKTLAFDTEVYDTNGLHDTVTNNSRITFDRLGAWLVEGQVGFASGTTGRRMVLIFRNGTEWARNNASANATPGLFIRCTAVVVCDTVGDYVQLMAHQDSGGSMNTAPSVTHFAATFLGA